MIAGQIISSSLKSIFGRCNLMLAVSLVLISATVASAADDLRVKLSLPNNGGIRSHTGLPLDIELDWQRNEMIEGYLELTFRETNNSASIRQTFFTYKTPDLVLLQGQKNLSSFLPAYLLRGANSLLTIDVRFVSPTQTFEIPPMTLIAPTGTQRRLLIGAVMADATVPEARTAYCRKLAFENMFEVSEDQLTGDQVIAARQQRSRIGKMVTRVDRVQALDFKKSANRLCAYDILSIADDALIRMKESQLNALATWIEAGGSAIVDTSGIGFERHHLNFLNRLAASRVSAESVFTFGEDNSIQFSGSREPNTKKIAPLITFRPGLGRVLVSPEPVGKTLNGNDGLCQAAAIFLWQARAGTSSSLKQASPKMGTLNSALVPSTVTGVPRSSVVAMLLLFLLAISVGDYFLLGLLGKRTWTWVLFPLISIGFTWYTIQMARHYVGSSDFTSAINIIDTTSSGQILRSSRLEMLFTATERPVTTKIRGGMMAPLTTHLNKASFDARYDPNSTGSIRAEFMMENAYGGSRWGGNNREDTREDSADDFMAIQNSPPTCSGQLPASYEVERIMRKWTPQVARYTSLGSKTIVDTPQFGWKVKDFQALISNKSKIQLWADAISSEYDDVQIGVLAAEKDKRIQLMSKQESSTAKVDEARWMSVWKFVSDVTTEGSNGVFAVTPRIAPTGGSFLSDLAVIDGSSGSTDATVVAIVRQGEEFFVFRHTIQGKPIWRNQFRQQRRTR